MSLRLRGRRAYKIMPLCYPDVKLDMGSQEWIVHAVQSSDLQRKRSMEMLWARRKALASRMHKIDTGILTGYAGMHNFV